MQRESLSTNNSGNQMNNRSSKRSISSNHQTTSNGSNNTNAPLSVQPSVPSLTPAQMYSNFEEWIKMCTDNVSIYISIVILY